MILGLRTINYHVSDLDQAKAWYLSVLNREPYFDQSFYVGFNVGGFELGLDPDPASGTPGTGGTDAYWGVENADAELERLVALGAEVRAAVHDVGDGIRVATVADPFGNTFGIIENPHFDFKAVE